MRNEPVTSTFRSPLSSNAASSASPTVGKTPSTLWYLDMDSDILSGEAARGIMFCGTGVGAAIACNKVPGIRASVCHDLYTAHQCVEHDDVQVIALGGQIIGHTVALELIERFLSARFNDSEEFRRRVQKLAQMDGSAQE